MPYVINPVVLRRRLLRRRLPRQLHPPRPGEPGFGTTEMLYIDARSCVGCGACATACPVGATAPDTALTSDQLPFIDLNAAYYDAFPHADRTPVALVPKQRRLTRPGPFRVAVVAPARPGSTPPDELLKHPEVVGVDVYDRLRTPYGLVRHGVAPDHASTKLVHAPVRGHRAPAALSATCSTWRSVARAALTLAEPAHSLRRGRLRRRRLERPHAGGARRGPRRLGGRHRRRRLCTTATPTSASSTCPSTTSAPWSWATATSRSTSPASSPAAPTCSSAPTWHPDRSRRCAAAACGRSSSSDDGGRRRRPSPCRSSSGSQHSRTSTSSWTPTPTCSPATTGTAVCCARSPSARPARLGPTPHRAGVRRLPGRDPRADGRVSGVRVARNDLVAHPDGTVRAVATEETRVIEAGLVIRSVGFKGRPRRRPALRRAPRHGAERGGARRARLYVVGWIKRGPAGFIGTNKTCAQETVASILDDLDAGLPSPAVADPRRRHRGPRRRPPPRRGRPRGVAAPRRRRTRGRCPRRPQPRQDLRPPPAARGVARSPCRHPRTPPRLAASYGVVTP